MVIFIYWDVLNNVIMPLEREQGLSVETKSSDNNDLAFFLREHEMLRVEIDTGKDRIFKIVTGQIFALPIADSISALTGSSAIMVVMPFIVLILVLTYLYEANSIFRAALYIRDHIENNVKLKNKSFVGWENWLEMNIGEKGKPSAGQIKYNPRNVELYMKWGFYMISAIYYIFSVSISIYYIISNIANNQIFNLINHGLLIGTIIGTYLVIGIIVVYLVSTKCLTSTSVSSNI